MSSNASDAAESDGEDAPPKTIHIFPGIEAFADRILVVGEKEKPTRIPIVGSSLCMTSKVFQAMMRWKSGGVFIEAKSAEISLPDDNADALVILLQLAHAQSHLVPKELDFERLLEVTILADKYDMMNLIEIYQDTWTKPLLTSEPLLGTVEQRFFLSWKFRKGWIRCSGFHC